MDLPGAFKAARERSDAAGVAIAITPPASTEEREYIDPAMTFPDILERLKGKTDLQKQALSKPYVGKWMRCAGIFNDLSQIAKGKFLVFIKDAEGDSVGFLFGPHALAELNSISVGDAVVVDGKIKSLTGGARFEDCELVEVIARA